MTENLRTNIIFDDPSKEDFFKGQGHRRLARALADSISQLSDRDGAIGLEGQWGAGKSTVVELAANELVQVDKQHKYEVFTFDLWTHQTDNFRRAFLEEFISWLENKTFLSSDEAESERDLVRDRRKTIRSKNRKRYTLWGAALIFALPFLPLAYAWIGPAAFQSAKPLSLALPLVGEVALPWVVLWIIVAFASIPLVMLGWKSRQWWLTGPAQFVSSSVKWLRSKIRFFGYQAPEASQWPQWHTFPKLGMLISETLRLFSRDVQEDKITQNIRDEDPTTAEFYSVFRKLLARVQTGKIRIVLVLDNIDRLHKDAVPSVWSEVRGIFSTADMNLVSGNTNVTAVVPYDRTHVLPAFKEASPTDKKSIDNDGDLFSKTFRRILRVSPPVATDWQLFLNDCIERVFEKQLDENCRYRLFRLLQLHFQIRRVHPTPRRIISYVNEIGVLWTQWGNDIPAESIALFVLHRKEIDADIDALKKPDLISSRFRHAAHQTEWRKHFAALTFNVDVERANQVLLGADIQEALIASEYQELEKLSELEGFREVLNDILPQAISEWAEENITLLSRAAGNLSKVGMDGEAGKLAWREFDASVRGLANLSGFWLDDISGMIEILKHQESSAILPHAKSLRLALDRNVELDDNDYLAAGRGWASSIAAICDAIAVSHGDVVADEFWKDSAIPGNADVCIGVADQSEVYPTYRFRELVRPASIKDIHAALEKQLEDDLRVYHDALKEILPVLDSSSKQASITSTANYLKSAKHEGKNAEYLLSAYWMLDGSLPSRAKSVQTTTLQSLVKDGTLLSYAHSSAGTEQHSMVGMALSLIFKSNGLKVISLTSNPHPVFGSLNPAADWFNELLSSGDLSELQFAAMAKLVASTGQLTRWLQYAVDDPTQNGLFALIAEQAIDYGDFPSIDLPALFSKYGQFREVLDDEHTRTLLSQVAMLSTDEAIQRVLDSDAVGALSPRLVEDIAAFARDTALGKVLVSVNSYLRNLSEQQWTEALSSESNAVGLLLAHRKSRGGEMPSLSFLPAVRDNVLQAFSGDFAPSKFASGWDIVVTSLKANSLGKMLNEIMKELEKITIETDGCAVVLQYYPSIAQNLPFRDFPRIAVNELLTALVRSSSASSDEYIQSKAKDFIDCLDNSTDTVRAAFHELVGSLVNSADDQQRTRGEALCRWLALPELHDATEGTTISENEGVAE